MPLPGRVCVGRVGNLPLAALAGRRPHDVQSLARGLLLPLHHRHLTQPQRPWLQHAQVRRQVFL